MTNARIDEMVRQGKLRLHHTALAWGYVGVGKLEISEYVGKFGKGYVVKSHNDMSTRYCHISYYVAD